MPSRPLPDITGGYLARIVGTWEGLPSDNTFGWRIVPAPASGSADVAAAQAIGDAMSTRWNAFASAAMHNSYRATEVQVYPLHTPTHPATTSAATSAGGLSGDPSPAPLAMLIKHDVVRRGRGSQSHSFVQPFTAAAIDGTGKSLITSFRDSVTADWTAFIADVITDVGTAVGAAVLPVQISKIPPGTPYAIATSECVSKLSTQRRRAR